MIDLCEGFLMKLHVTNVLSTQEVSVDPDMIEVEIGRIDLELWQRAHSVVQSMDAEHMSFPASDILYDFFKESVSNQPTREGINGVDYDNFVPDYSLGSESIKVFNDGTVRLSIDFDTTSDELWVDLGTVECLVKAFDDCESTAECSM